MNVLTTVLLVFCATEGDFTKVIIISTHCLDTLTNNYPVNKYISQTAYFILYKHSSYHQAHNKKQKIAYTV